MYPKVGQTFSPVMQRPHILTCLCDNRDQCAGARMTVTNLRGSGFDVVRARVTTHEIRAYHKDRTIIVFHGSKALAKMVCAVNDTEGDPDRLMDLANALPPMGRRFQNGLKVVEVRHPEPLASRARKDQINTARAIRRANGKKDKDYSRKHGL